MVRVHLRVVEVNDAGPGTAPILIPLACNRAARRANWPYSGRTPDRPEDVGVDHEPAAGHPGPLAGLAPACMDHVEPALAQPSRNSFGVVPDVEVSDLGGRARREPPGDRIETPGVRQTVPFGEHEPNAPGSPRHSTAPRRGPGETQQLVVRAQEGRHFRLLRGGGAVGGDHHAVPVPRESLRGVQVRTRSTARPRRSNMG